TDSDHPYLIWEGGELTIGQLHASANRLANALTSRGLRRGDVVALMLDQHADHIITLFACAMIGLVRTSINVNAKGEYLSLLLADASPELLIAENSYRAVLADGLGAAPVREVIWRRDGAEKHLDELAPLLEGGSDTPVASPLHPDDPLVINYTSGTTGAPKKFTRSDRVVRIGCIGCLIISEAEPGDVW